MTFSPKRLVVSTFFDIKMIKRGAWGQFPLTFVALPDGVDKTIIQLAHKEETLCSIVDCLRAGAISERMGVSIVPYSDYYEFNPTEETMLVVDPDGGSSYLITETEFLETLL